ncbi:hypothetical protein I5168_10135 [Nonlabens sp. SCSIO 43208]|uniref:hypothetical protein n=1 Tax=Nonlabens sp. SCSIO 43208 TaxID=2793009 RepID=UPI003D6A8799
MKFFYFILILCSVQLSVGQVGIGTTIPNSAAALDINAEISTGVYGGLKLPTVTLVQRAAITTPIPDGMMIYLSDGSLRCLQIYSQLTGWDDVYCMNQPPVAANVVISSENLVGETLSTTYDETNSSFQTDNENDTPGLPLYQWYTNTTNSGVGTPIAGATNNTYTITAADAGNYIYLGITPTTTTGASPGIEAISSYSSQIEYAPTIVEFDPQLSTISEGAVPDDINLVFEYPYTSTTAVDVTISSDDYSRLQETGPVTITIPANQTSPYTTTVFNVQDNLLLDGTANLTFTITNVTGGLGTNSIGTDDTDLWDVYDDDGVPVLLGIQDFETTPALPTLNYIDNATGSLQTGVGTAPNTPTYIDSRSYGVNNDYADIDFGSVDASGFSSVTATFRLASFSLISNGNGADGGDYIDVYVSTDGGLTYSYELEILGNNNRRYDFSATGSYSLNYDGDNISTSVVTPTGAGGYSTVTITGIPNSANLVFSIVMYNDNDNELWVIDNVELYGNP